MDRVLAWLLLWGGAACMFWVGISMWKRPDQPPPGWRLGSVPPPERMRLLAVITIVAAVVWTMFAFVASWATLAPV